MIEGATGLLAEIHGLPALAVAFGVPPFVVFWVWVALGSGRLVRDFLANRGRAVAADRQFLLDVCARMDGEAARAKALIDQYSQELAQLRQAREQLASGLAMATEAALAARLMVHELQDRDGLARTEFPPLPQASAAIPAGTPAPPQEA